MRKISLLMLTLTLLLLPGTALASVYDTPQKTLQSYYHAINQRDYRAAYDLWMIAEQPLATFSAGFADTLRVEPYFGEAIPAGRSDITGGRAVQVPAALVTYKTSSTIAWYYGCFDLSQPFASSDQWVIDDGRFVLAPPEIPPVLMNIESVMDMNCNIMSVTWNGIGRAYNFDYPSQWLRDYYGLINDENYSAAYALWLQPLPGPKPNGAPPEDYRSPFGEFVSGYANTQFISVYTGDYVFTGSSAGRPYLDGVLPTVLVGQNSDGAFETFAGCYVFGGLSNDIGIVSGTFTKVADGIITGSTLVAYLQQDCFSLNLKI